MSNTPSEFVALALNSGSSSLKFGLYRVGASGTDALFTGVAESIGEPGGQFQVRDSQGNVLTHDTAPIPNQRDAVIRIGNFFEEAQTPAPAAIGHRVVHGGPKLRQHCLIDENVSRQLEAAAAFAPLHTPAALSVIRFAQEHFPRLPQVACFDTTFHAGMPDVARVLPVPRELQVLGIQRYGFHGLSCESIVHQLGDDVPSRLIIAHLGNGASVTAVKDGKSIDTSMGLTPSGGVIMGTRSGDLDPGVLVYLMRELAFDAVKLEHMIDHRSGLMGISATSSDMRRLHDASSENPDARLAIDMFCYSVRKQIAAMIAVLGGIDLIVFTGGIGENDGAVRGSICAGLSWAGVSLDSAPNVRVKVLASQEDEQIARHTRTVSLAG
ncbi:acetate/propionate family kinase [Afipia sp. GAS231]|uniref:acetate/propionate family kinase n=1 Tax=Afipia sp. GAS231 TaxID=1882747 RepID=UPI00087DDEE9|nr:acetate/propionate family kinase [Afipia sp. GAS231]SDM87832.1 acetate kinase [Afipia sp. GAS231]